MTASAPKAARPYGARNSGLSELLAKRDMTVELLATVIFSGPSHLTQVLRGQRRGTRTWNKLRRVMNADELRCAMEFANLKLAEKRLCLKIEGEKVVAAQLEPEALKP